MGKIETRNFGNGEISLLGFGLMRLPCLGSWEEIDRKAARALIEEAIAGGVNYFDTAYIYHVGNSESLAGETLSGYDRSAYHLATKMPLMEEVIKNAGGVDSIFNAQLERCCVDYFDFYLLHGVTADALRMIGDLKIYETLAKKKTEGRIRHLGFSFHDNPELLRRMTSDYDFDFAQIQLNYFDWEAQSAKEQYEILEGKKIPVHVMEPIKGGTLATLRPRALKIFEEADSHASAASWALRWVASLSGVQVVLSGMSAMEQLRDNIKTFTPFKPLTEEEYAVVEKALAEFKKTAAVPCTGCRYCMDCPQGVDIPKNLVVYNNYQYALSEKYFNAAFLFDTDYRLIREENQAGNCTACGQCKSRCPQHIDIPRWMSETTKLREEIKW